MPMLSLWWCRLRHWHVCPGIGTEDPILSRQGSLLLLLLLVSLLLLWLLLLLLYESKAGTHDWQQQ